MNIAIRVDASTEIGTGHVMRCLTLAEHLRKEHAKVTFICSDFPGNLFEYIKEKGFNVYLISHKEYRRNLTSECIDWEVDVEKTKEILREKLGIVDWLIVDNYFLDYQWEQRIGHYVKKIMVIDDLANRKHICNILLDQTFSGDGSRYKNLINDGCRGLYGGKYALLRPEFAIQSAKNRKKDVKFEEYIVHVFFGGVDKDNYTFKFSRLILKHFPFVTVNAAVGAQYSYTDSLIELSNSFFPRFDFKRGISNMAAHMSNATVAIGAPGVTTWERCCIGLPSLYMAISVNQQPILEFLESKGLCLYAGKASEISDEAFIRAFDEFINNKNKLKSIRKLGLSHIDGYGAERICSILLS